MALTAAGLKAAMLTQMTAQLGAAEDATKRDKLVTAISTAVIDYIKANGAIVVTVTSVAGVTAGPGVSGPGTGTGTIT